MTQKWHVLKLFNKESGQAAEATILVEETIFVEIVTLAHKYHGNKTLGILLMKTIPRIPLLEMKTWWRKQHYVYVHIVGR